MSSTRTRPRKRLRTDALEPLTVGRRRRILAVLEQSSPVTEVELATILAAADAETAPADVAADRVRTVRADLAHVQLPALADAGLVAWDRDDATVTATARRVLADGGFRTIVDPDAEEWDDVLDCLASERRRRVLSILRGYDGRMARADLARAVAASETLTGQDDRGAGSAETVLYSLYHVHLPKLDEAGLVDVHPDEGTVAYRGHPDLPVADVLHLFDPDRS